MPAPANNDEFVDLVVRSGVVDEAKLKAHLAHLRAQNHFPPGPNKLAGVLVRDGILTYFQADQILQGKWKRFSIGKYRVLEKLGTGGMGQVFLCEHKFMKRRVAVKVLPAAKASDPASLERFYREARAVAALDHPNIVRAYDIDQDAGLHFIVMEYVDGTNLQDLVKKVGPLDYTRACHYIYGCAVGLQHAHEMGLVHRDIKPGNILVDRAGVVKILDMGLARFFRDEDDKLTKKYDENILGTADYVAPEQALDSHSVDIRADIYSLGATFYYLLANQALFPEGSVAQKLLWHQTREPAPIRSIRPDLPLDLANLLAKMMAKSPDQRFQTPSEVMNALTPWVMTPIAPPSERELPQLSPAASPSSGNLARQADTIPTTPRPVPMPRPQATTPTHSAAELLLPTDTASSPRYESIPISSPTPTVTSVTSSGIYPGAQLAQPLEHTLVPQPAANPPASPGLNLFVSATPSMGADQPAEEAPPIDPFWGSVAVEGEDTDPPTSSATEVSRPQAAPASRGPNRRVLLFAVLIGLGITVVSAGAAAVLFMGGPSQPVVDPELANVWYITKSGQSPNPAHTLTSLRGVFEQLKPGERIIILDDQITDPPVTLSGRRGNTTLHDITIEAGNAAKSVLWTPQISGTIRQSSVLEVLGVESSTISNLVIDCGDTMPAGLGVGLSCPGTTFSNITIKNPKKYAVGCYVLKGERNRPVQFQNIVVSSNEKLEAAISLDGSRSSCQDIVIDQARLQGPGEHGILIRGSITDLEIRNSRLFHFTQGITLAAFPPPANDYRLTITHNTFFQMTGGLHIEGEMKSTKWSVALSNNYFGRTKEIVGAKTAQPRVTGKNNARDKASTDGKLTTDKAKLLTNFELSPNQSVTDSDFLALPHSASGFGPKP